MEGPGSKLILGIETSCDETAAALVTDDGELRASVVASQADLHARFGGVVPEVASRRHLELVSPVIREALAEADATLDDVDRIDIGHPDPGVSERLLDHRSDELEVPAGCNLGHDAAEACVQLVLRRDDARVNLTVRADDRSRRLVARGLDPEDHAVGRRASRHMINASSRLSV